MKYASLTVGGTVGRSRALNKQKVRRVKTNGLRVKPIARETALRMIYGVAERLARLAASTFEAGGPPTQDTYIY